MGSMKGTGYLNLRAAMGGALESHGREGNSNGAGTTDSSSVTK